MICVENTVVLTAGYLNAYNTLKPISSDISCANNSEYLLIRIIILYKARLCCK